MSDAWVYESVEDELRRLRYEVQQKSAAADSFAELAERYKQELAALRNNESKAARNARTFSEENRALKEEVELLRETNEMVSRRLATLEGTLQSAHLIAEARVTNELSALRTDLAAAKLEVAALTQANRDVKDQNRLLKGLLDKGKTDEQVAHYKNQADLLRSQVTQLQKNCEEYKKQLRHLKAQTKLDKLVAMPDITFELRIPQRQEPLSIDEAIVTRSALVAQRMEIDALLRTYEFNPEYRLAKQKERAEVAAVERYLGDWIKQQNIARSEAIDKEMVRSMRRVLIKLQLAFDGKMNLPIVQQDLKQIIETYNIRPEIAGIDWVEEPTS